MKKLHKLCLTILMGVLCSTAYGQIPNPDFELWNTKTTNVLDGWNTIGNVTRINGYASTYAARLETDSMTGAPGAVVYGIPTNNYVTGGIPYSQKPDSVSGYFRYDIKKGDEAWLLVMFKKFGFPIAVDTFRITGSQTAAFQRMSFKLKFLITNPDSVIVGITNTRPDNSMTGGYMEVDSLRFNTSQAIPNGNFESWTPKSTFDPMGWFPGVSNIPTLPPVVTRSTDSYSGKYAMQIRSFRTATDTVPGFVSTGNLISLGGPHFPVLAKHKSITGYYKYSPQNGDTALIFSSLFLNGKMIGTGNLFITDTALTYKPFTMTYTYFGTGTPDSANLFMGSSMVISKVRARGNSVLLVDAFQFDTLFTGIEKNLNIPQANGMKCYPNPFKDEVNISYTVTEPCLVHCSIYDLSGKEVIVSRDAIQNPGQNQMKINTSSLPAGTYLYRLQVGNTVSESKLIRFR